MPPSNPSSSKPPSGHLPETDPVQLNTVSDPVQATPVSTEMLPVPYKKHKKHLILRTFLIIAALIVFVIVSLFAWIYLRHVNITFGSNNKDVGIIRAAVFEGDMSQFAPKLGSDDPTLYLNRQIFEGLVRFEDQTKITPWLATSWNNPDDMTWIFTLKQNVKFHTGNTMTAKDVVYSFDQLKQNSNYGYVFSTIKSVEAVGDDKVKITTKTPDPILINRLADMFIIDSTADGKADPIYGTGPYLLKPGTTATKNQINLVAFPDYHGGHIYTREVQVNVYSGEDTAGTALGFLKGNLNLIGFVPSGVVSTAKTLRFNINSKDDPSVYMIQFNTLKKGSPLANLKIRQAIYQTVDVPTLLDAIGRSDTGTISKQVIPPLIPGYNPDITRPNHDLDAARQLVKDAGYPNGTSFTLSVYSAAQDAGKEIARQLGQVGITVKLDVRDDVTQIAADQAAGKLEASYFAEGSSIVDASDVFQTVADGHNYANSAINSLMKQADSTFNPAQRLDDLKQVSKLLADDVAVVPLYTNRLQWITDKAYVMVQDELSNGFGVYLYKVQMP